jgi:hypothetical protein
MSTNLGTGAFSSLQVVNELRVLSPNSYFSGNIVTSGNVAISGNISVSGPVDMDELVLVDTDSDKTITLTAPTLTADYSLTLPVDVGTIGQILSTDGTGVLSWSTDAAGSPSGSNTQVQFNDDGSFGASANLAFDKSSSTLTLGGDDSELSNPTGNIIINATITRMSADILLGLSTSSGTAATGDISIVTGDSTTGQAGNIELIGGNTSADGIAGNVSIAGGESTNAGGSNGGPVSITGGDTVTGLGGNITMYAGVASGTGTGGDVFISSGSGVGTGGEGGDVKISALTGADSNGRITLSSDGIVTAIENGGITLEKGTVTQITDINTAVILSNKQGIISSSATALPADTTGTFTVTNTTVLSNSIILTNIVNYAGTGEPIVSRTNVSAGSFDIFVRNVDSINALSTSMDIGFVVL